jgi:hypothetical protein
MVQHVSVGDEGVRLMAVYLDSKNARSYHHSEFTVLFEGELFILGHLLANHRVVGLDVFDLV